MEAVGGAAAQRSRLHVLLFGATVCFTHMMRRIFAPGANSTLTNIGLLLLRVWLGLTIFLAHGLGKLQGFGEMHEKFPDPLGVGNSMSLALAVFAEAICGVLLVIGLLTRFAALSLAITMFVAFAIVHRMAMTGPQSGELAFIYLAGFVALTLAGPGAYSLDQRLFKAPAARRD